MRTLFLDLASHSDVPSQGASSACVDTNETRSIRFVDHRMSDDQLMPLIKGVVQEAGWTYKDLTHIAVVKGPGGFTSLRMAVTLANVFADQLQIPSVGVHLSDVYEARVNYELRSKNYGAAEMHNSQFLIPNSFLWFHSTKKTELFIRTFGLEDSPWIEPVLISIDDLLATTYNLPPSWSGELIPAHREALASKNLEPAPLASLEDALPAFLSAQTYDKELVLPWYGRGW